MIVGVGGEGRPHPQAARLAFAAARHAAADVSHALGRRPTWYGPDRLPAADLARVRTQPREAGVPLPEGPEADAHLAELRRLYEPFVSALADELLMPLPRWLPREGARDAWQTTLWGLAEGEPGRVPPPGGAG